MNRVFTIIASIITLVFSQAAMAQDSWVQIQARPTQDQAESSAREYTRVLEDVNGFALNSGWYAITLGPYSEFEAQQVLSGLRQRRLIPNDSFIADGSQYRSRFWPNNTTGTITQSELQVAPETDSDTAPAQQPEPADETVAQARASEALLSADERKLLQTALQWAGHYNSTIDGAFGRGTRASMEAYQWANGYEPTGVLTTLQRTRLLADYNAILEGLNIQTIRNDEAGVEIAMPTALVEFTRYSAPFVHYDSTTNDGARVLLISQAGDRDSLGSLYEVMQTLEIVPRTGDRRLRRNSFTLTGQNSRIHSHTEARLDNGLIKGFILIWPAGDEQRMERVLQTMRASFSPFGDYALDENLGTDAADQNIDLLAGLELRKPLRTRSGFFIAQNGMLLTSVDAVDGCGLIAVDGDTPADLVLRDDTLGIAVLTPQQRLAPAGIGQLVDGVGRLNASIAVAGYPYGGILGAPSVSFGQLADIRGLRGEEHQQRLSLNTQLGDLGGPVMTTDGQVIGVLVPVSNNTIQLPDDVAFAARSDAIVSTLQENNLLPGTDTGGGAPSSAAELMSYANDMTVLVSCWE